MPMGEWIVVNDRKPSGIDMAVSVNVKVGSRRWRGSCEYLDYTGVKRVQLFSVQMADRRQRCDLSLWHP